MKIVAFGYISYILYDMQHKNQQILDFDNNFAYTGHLCRNPLMTAPKQILFLRQISLFCSQILTFQLYTSMILCVNYLIHFFCGNSKIAWCLTAPKSCFYYLSQRTRPQNDHFSVYFQFGAGRRKTMEQKSIQLLAEGKQQEKTQKQP